MEHEPSLRGFRARAARLRARVRRWPPGTLPLALACVLIAAFCIVRMVHRQGAAPDRTALPTVALPAGTLTLVTEPQAGMAPVLALIRSATRSLDLVMYEFQDREIGDALVAAQARGVAVRVLVDHGYYGAPDAMNDAAYAYLQAAGVPVKWTPVSFALTHQKTLVADGSRALIMTFNFTPRYYATSRDFAVLDSDPTDVAAIGSAFDADWTGSGAATTAAIGSDLVWSPGSRGDMLLAIAAAKKTLDVYNEEMQDPQVTAALVDAAKRGVAVRVVMTYETIDKAAFAQLAAGGVAMRTFGGGKHTLYIHAKMIVADGREAFLGSENFSATSLEKNRELGLFVSDPGIVASLESTFAGDFAAARPFAGG